MQRPADTTVYRLVHRAIVTSAARLADAAGQPECDVADLAPWAAGFIAEVRWHQADEDAHRFPALVEQVPAAAALVERLGCDHHELGLLLDQLEVAMADPCLGAERAAVAGRLHDLLAAHVFDEDVNIAPMIERHLSFDEHQAELVAVAERMPLREAAWAVPWLLASCSRDERGHVEAVLPERLVAIDRLCARRYRRLEEAAFGG